jgi:hypothetical protein
MMEQADIRRHYTEWRLLKSTVDEHKAFQDVIRTVSSKLTSDRNALKTIVSTNASTAVAALF